MLVRPSISHIVVRKGLEWCHRLPKCHLLGKERMPRLTMEWGWAKGEETEVIYWRGRRNRGGSRKDREREGGGRKWGERPGTAEEKENRGKERGVGLTRRMRLDLDEKSLDPWMGKVDVAQRRAREKKESHHRHAKEVTVLGRAGKEWNQKLREKRALTEEWRKEQDGRPCIRLGSITINYHTISMDQTPRQTCGVEMIHCPYCTCHCSRTRMRC